MYLVTGLLSEVLTNNAAAALMYPIAANVGDDMGIEVRPTARAALRNCDARGIQRWGVQVSQHQRPRADGQPAHQGHLASMPASIDVCRCF